MKKIFVLLFAFVLISQVVLSQASEVERIKSLHEKIELNDYYLRNYINSKSSIPIPIGVQENFYHNDLECKFTTIYEDMGYVSGHRYVNLSMFMQSPLGESLAFRSENMQFNSCRHLLDPRLMLVSDCFLDLGDYYLRLEKNKSWVKIHCSDFTYCGLIHLSGVFVSKLDGEEIAVNENIATLHDLPSLLQKQKTKKEEKEKIIRKVSTDQSEISYKIYPNPVSNFLSLELLQKAEGRVSIEIYNSIGKVLISDELDEANKHTKKYDLSNYQSGLYFIKIVTGNNVFVEKFFKVGGGS